MKHLLLALFALTPALLQAQVSAEISGRVEDATGSAVGGVTVTVKSLETGATRSVVTDSDGNFHVLSLPVGQQELKAEKTGFKSVVRTGINLAVGQEAVVDLQLEVGELVQQVTVIAEAPVVNTTTSSVSGLVSEREIKDLPLNGRSFDNLIALNPGAISYGLKSANTITSMGNTFSVAGKRPLDNIFLLNGVEYTGSSQLSVTPGGVSGELLGIDAVREFNVLTETYSAEYGKRAGAQVIVVTQSGTNQLHGSLFEFLRNSALDARNTFDQGFVPPFRRNQFGAALGGPIKKDKLFLFGNYEGFQQRLAVTNVSVVPDAQARTGFLPNAAGVYTKVANLNPAMLNYMSFWPLANGPELLVPGTNLPSGTAKAFYNPKQSIHENFGTLRSDYILSDRDSLSGSYTIDDGNSVIPQADPLFGSAVALRSQVLSAQETHIFSPRILNSFTAGFSRAAFGFGSLTFVPFAPSLDFVTGLGPGGIVVGGGTTTTGLASITSAGPNNAAGVSNARNLFTLEDSVQIVKGIHQFSFGVWFQRLRDNEDTGSRRIGLANFASLTTFLQGTTSTFQVLPNPSPLGWRNWMGAWYVEDTIKLRPNLTLRAGLRDEFTNGWNEADGRAANYVTDSNGVLVTNPAVGNSVYTKNNATKLFGPRVGLAWDPFGNGNTAVRAGFGTYYSMIDNLAFLLNSLPPYNGSATFSGSLFNDHSHHARRAAPRLLHRRTQLARRRLLHLRAPRHPARCQDAHGPGVELYRRTAPQFQHGFARRLRRLLRNPRPAQHRPQHHSRRDLRQRSGLHRRRSRHQRRSSYRRESEPRPARRSIHPRRHASESLVRRRLLLVHRRQQPLQRAANRRRAPFEQRFSIPLQLHLVQKSGYEFRTNRSPIQQPGANDHGSQRPQPRLGSVGLERSAPSQHLRALRASIRKRPPVTPKSHHRWMAGERHRHAIERLPVHAAVRLQPFR